ncbi:Peptidyl-prolyl cis-trans isomerase CYPA-like 2 [Homarus americanus]|uniref:Peptidyl-prolyl cis-trans isomerase CYPA-like 2 n=1 Tax=Homarus americanus TaxID=6706 RepID=A0A8J5MQZ0_HOMAM|nr:Peptidyl-prolyl cis-trans isomerase CYPA-like 2 [Homarus americanus]
MLSNFMTDIIVQVGLGRSPQPSPNLQRRFPTLRSIPDAATSSEQFFVDFSCQDQPQGRIVLEGTSNMGLEFMALLTGKRGYGYKGSRVFACCQNDWCMMGDLLYDAPQVLITTPHHDWDPLEEDDDDDDDNDEECRFLRSDQRCLSVIRCLPQQELKQGDVRGTVVAVASDLHLDPDRYTWSWTLGPQFKICLSDSFIRVVQEASKHEIKGSENDQQQQQELYFDDPLDPSNVDKCQQQQRPRSNGFLRPHPRQVKQLSHRLSKARDAEGDADRLWREESQKLVRMVVVVIVMRMRVRNW